MSKYKEELKFLLANSERRQSGVSREDLEVKELCERVGYGAVMDSVARQWRKKDPTGAFVVGPCIGTLEELLGK